MKLPVKYIILGFAFIAGIAAFSVNNIAPGIASAGAFIGYALIEIQDLKIINQEDNEG
ncbi:hypothetical protein [Ferruginibacter sp. SUN106]|uniref:hypothetical protein n=1 Tax=Ferruginibacter sp. SUN106 TaxID=2978348 RepID=UPI003D35C59D